METTNQIWIDRCWKILRDTKNASKNRFVISVIQQAQKNPNIPTFQQIRILRPMFDAWERRQKEKLIQEASDVLGETVYI